MGRQLTCFHLKKKSLALDFQRSPLCPPSNPAELPLSFPILLLPVMSFLLENISECLLSSKRKGKRWASGGAEKERGAMPYPLLF